MRKKLYPILMWLALRMLLCAVALHSVGVSWRNQE